MRARPELPPDARPLRLVPGYCITADGRVFRSKDGKAVRSMPLREAKRCATGALEFDANRLSRQPLGEVQPESLVYIGQEEIEWPDGRIEFRPQQYVQWVRGPTRSELQPRVHRSTVSVSSAWFGGATMHAAGDTESGWYRIDLTDGAWILFHGPSTAASELQRS